MKPFGIVYLLIDKTNGMGYVGQTTQTLKARFRQHRTNKRHDMYIDNMIRACGAKNFDCLVLRECATQGELNFWEQFFIILLGTKVPNGYNLKDGGDGGGHHSQETCAQMSESRRGENNPAYNKTSSQRKSPYKNLLAAMAERGINTYRELAELMGISVSKLSRKMSGETYFTDDEKSFLVDYFGKPVEYLFARNDGKSAKPKPTPKKKLKPKPKRSKSLLNCKSPYKNLLAAIVERGITKYTEIAEPMKMAPNTFRNKMRGKSNFTAEQKAFIADYLGKPVEYLFKRDDGKSSESNRGNPAQNRGHCPYPNILKAMAKCNLQTYDQLAERAGVSPKNFGRKMTGIRNFTNEDKVKISNALGETIEYLFVRDDGIKVVSDCGRCPYKNLEAEIVIREISRCMLAKLLKIPRGTLSDRIYGRGEFTNEQKAKLVEIFGKPIEYLLARDDA